MWPFNRLFQVHRVAVLIFIDVLNSMYLRVLSVIGVNCTLLSQCLKCRYYVNNGNECFWPSFIIAHVPNTLAKCIRQSSFVFALPGSRFIFNEVSMNGWRIRNFFLIHLIQQATLLNKNVKIPASHPNVQHFSDSQFMYFSLDIVI